MHIAARLRTAGRLGVIDLGAEKVCVIVNLNLVLNDIPAVRVAQVKLQGRCIIGGTAAVVVIVDGWRIGG